MNRALRLLAIFLGFAVLGGAATAFVKFNFRPSLDGYRAHLAPLVGSAPGAVTATWFGTTSILLSDGEQSLLVDPFFTRPAGWPHLLSNARIAPDEERIARALSGMRLRNPAAVLVSHSHYDHAMDAGVVARLTGAPLVGSASTANIGRGAGLPESQLRIVRAGEAMTFGTYTVTFIESGHAGATGGRPSGDITEPLVTPARYGDYRQGGTWSILVQHARGTVLLHGSAGFVPGALHGRHADVALLGVALVGDLDTYLRETLDTVGARRVLPTHWDDFTRPLDQPLRPMPFGVKLDEFFEGIARTRPQVQVQAFDLAVPVTLF